MAKKRRKTRFEKMMSSLTVITVLFVFVSYGMIGFLDDYLSIKRKTNKGLTQTQKLFLQFVVALIFLGAPSIQNFSIALLIGLVTGMYSSICIAAQVWYSLKVREMDKKGTAVVKKEKKQWGSDEPQV